VLEELDLKIGSPTTGKQITPIVTTKSNCNGDTCQTTKPLTHCV
jgi:hypothetical protein